MREKSEHAIPAKAGISLKAGVSLVTVLLFMLVATIAATATYKWLTSESRSSGARLQKQAAYQSAMAGIENARAWMTYNANDVGALIKQYKDTGKKIKLNSRLTPWSNSDHNYDVWLAGVNTGAAHNFKLKIVSSGTSSGGTVHNEIAIFNVDGLYQIQIPSEEVGGATFDKAFDGKMTGITGNDTLQSGIVHGDFVDQNNTPKLSGNFVIAGDMGFGGHVHGNGDMYVKGSITSKNGGYTFGNDLKSIGMFGWVTDLPDTNVVYVGGDVDCADNQPIRVYGDLYVGGKIKERCSIDVTGNLTIGGGIDRTNTAAKNFTIGKNLVFKKDAVFRYTSTIEYGTGGTAGTGVGVNTYLAKLEGKDKNGGRKVNFGKKIYLYDNVTEYTHCQNRDNGSTWYRPMYCTYCEGFFSTCDGDERYSKEDDRYFSIYNPLFGYTVSSRVSDTRISSWSKTDDVLKDVSNNYWDNIAKMEGYGKIIKNDGTIPQAMLLKDSLAWIAKARTNVANCKMNVGWKTEPKDVKALNDCYKDAKLNHTDWLYGGFLPIEWQYAEDKDPGEERLDGNFLIYASTAVGNTTLPATTATGIVMFYFDKGVNGQLKGKHDDRRHRDWVYNYFFYSNGDIKEIHGFNIKGSIVMSNGTTMQKYQGGNKVEFSSTVINALVNAGIIKENPEFTRLVNGTSGSSSGGEGSTSSGGSSGGTDPYFIAASPQLRITLESQYENNEPLPVAAEEVEPEPAFMVLPRIIYLPKNPYGKLTDYFSVVPLNGAEVVKDENNIIECSGDIPRTTLLYDRGNGSAPALTPGLHTCQYSALSKTIPFYVYVYDSDISNLPLVQFETDYEELGVGDAAQVKMTCPAGQSSQEFKIKVTKPNDLPASWTITHHTGATLDAGTCEASDAECTFKFNFSSDCSEPKPLFDITTNATEGTAVFQMACISGCLTGSPSTEKFVASSSVTINRAGLKEYCALEGVNCSDDMKSAANRPDCKSEGMQSWVKAVGTSGSTTNICSITDPNESWTCGVSTAIELSTSDLTDNVPAGCEVIIPSDATHNKISNPQSSETYTLYASLKAKIYGFTVSFAGDKLAGKQIEVRSDRFTDGSQTCTYAVGKTSCTYQLYAGDKVEVVVPTSSRTDFSYWKCTPGTSNVNCPSNDPMTGSTYTIEAIGGTNSVTAWFGQKDQHCFFDEFNTSKVCSDHEGTGDKKYCLSYCTLPLGNCTTNNAPTDVKWFVFGGQDERNNLLQYEDGKVWLKDTYVRGKKQSEVTALKILSTRVAGLYGTLRAQFQVPQLGRGGNEASAKVSNSGFILHSDNAASEYVMLNVFANRNGKLAAKVCIADACRDEELMANMGTVSVSSTDVITLSATIKAEGSKDILEVEAVLGNYGSYTTASTRFELTGIEGYAGLTTRGVNEYVGFSLSDPAFQIYDVGWKSEDYNATCWDSYPTVKCSFRVAYVGGIVPLGTPAKPWVGLSSWFDDKSCTPKYYYNGGDATSGCYGMESEGYKECYSPDYYKFSGENASGLHGTTVDGVETKMAMARIQDCDASYLSELNRNSLYAEAAKCGEFWVGNFTNCNQNVTFFSEALGRTLSKHSGALTPITINSTPNELFALGDNAVANLRAANIRIILDNPNASEVEVYLRSTTTDGYGYYGVKQVLFSTSATTTANGVVNISVEDLSNEVGFDVEHVNGVVVRNLGEYDVTVKEIRSTCDYVTSIQCKNLEYTGGKFKVNAVVKQASDVSGYSIVGKDGNDVTVLSEKMWTCGNEGVDCPTGDNEGKIVLESDAYNPYSEAFDEEKSFVFTVNMYDAPNHHAEGSPCTTSPVLKIQPISAECKWSTTNAKPSIPQGSFLPDFQYKLPDCGGKTCAWEIYLDGTRIHQGTGEIAGYTSLPSDVRNGYNQNTENATTGKLAATDHTIYFKNKSVEGGAVFNECSKTFTVIDANSGTGNLTCSVPAEVLPGAQIKNLDVYSTLEAQNFKVYFKKSDSETWTAGNGGNNLWVNNGQNSFGYINAPTAFGTYTYKMVKDGGTETECSGTIDVINPLGCNIKNKVEVGVQNVFEVTAKSGYSCSNCRYSNVSCGDQCSGHGVANYNFTMNNTTPLTLSVTCQCDNIDVTCSKTAVAEVVAPTVSCSGTFNVEPSSAISFTATPTHCEGGCEYWVENADNTKITPTNGTISSSSTVSFTGEGDKLATGNPYTYNLFVKNDAGQDDCSVTVNYQKPSYSCPTTAITAEPGTQITVTPVLGNPSYCATNGCGYSISGGSFSDGTTSGTGFKSGSLEKKIVDNSNPFGGTNLTDGSGVSKTYSLTLSNAAGSGTACNVNVNYKKPTFTCPGNLEVYVNDSVIVPSVNPQYCSKGCSYSITGGTFTDGETTGDGFTSGDLPKKIKGKSSASSGDGDTYTLTVSNPAGSNTQSCSFKVKTVARPVLVATCELSKTGPYVPGATNIQFNVSNFKNIVNSEFTGTFACTPASTNASGETSCNPNNGNNGQCNQLTLKAPDEARTYTCTFKNGTTDLCGNITMTVFDPFTCSVKQDGVEVTSVAKGSSISFSMTQSTNSLGDASFSNCGIKVNGSCWNSNNNNCNNGAANVTNQSIPINTNSSSITIGYSCNSHSNTSFTGCSKTIEVTGGGGGGGSGGGSGTDVELSSQGMDSYTKGTYTLKTGSGLGSGPVPRTFKCRTENIRPSTIRVVGTIYLGDEKKYDISISAHNDYSQGYDLNSETTYTFNVDNSIDNLECGLWF